MSALRTIILVAWVLFWGYWLVCAAGVKAGTRTAQARPVSFLMIVVWIVLARVVKAHGLAVTSPALEIVGTIVLISGLGLAMWARVFLGRNWGMPMTQKDEPELVTSGPYRLIRHPIYTGILLGMLGTALATNLVWLIVLALTGAYFIYSARVEERFLSACLPGAYPAYRAKTKMLVPFVL